MQGIVIHTGVNEQALTTIRGDLSQLPQSFIWRISDDNHTAIEDADVLVGIRRGRISTRFPADSPGQLQVMFVQWEIRRHKRLLSGGKILSLSHSKRLSVPLPLVLHRGLTSELTYYTPWRWWLRSIKT
jgi:hypothetical protein